MKIKNLFVTMVLSLAMVVGLGTKAIAQYTMCFHTPPVVCPFNPLGFSYNNGTICVTLCSTDCGGSCTDNSQYCADLEVGSTETCVSIPDCSFNTCMTYVVTLIPAYPRCNDANADSDTGYGLAWNGTNWVLSPYGEHGGGPITLVINSDNTFTVGPGL